MIVLYSVHNVHAQNLRMCSIKIHTLYMPIAFLLCDIFVIIYHECTHVCEKLAAFLKMQNNHFYICLVTLTGMLHLCLQCMYGGVCGAISAGM